MSDSTLPTRPSVEPADQPLVGATTLEEAFDAALKSRGMQQSLLVEVNTALTGALDVDDVLEQILFRLTERARLVNASISLFDEAARQLRCVAQSGFPDAERVRSLAVDGPGLVAWVAREREAAYVPDVTRDDRYLCGDPRARSEYAVPLLTGSSLLGVLDIESGERDGIRAVTRKLIDQFAGQAALAIERSDLYRRLQSSERRFRSIFEQSHLGTALCDLERKFLTVNPALAEILGYLPSELAGITTLDVTHAEDREESGAQIGLLLEGKVERCIREERYVRKSGEAVWCSTITSLIRDASGKPSYTLAMVSDISERKRAEQERERMQEQLLQAQKMKSLGTLAGGIAHDFNNFLGVISGYASLLRLRLSAEDPRQELAAIMQQSAERASELTGQLLQFSRQEAPQLQPVDVVETVRSVINIISQTFDRRICVQQAIPSQSIYVEGNSSQLEMGLLNLCINARDAMLEGGTLTLKASVVNLASGDLPPEAPAPPGRYVRIYVQDTGGGMDPEIMRRIFEPFFTTKEAGKGIGLGLAMVYGIVMHHKGFIGVRSQRGWGSEFAIHLPLTERLPEAGEQDTISAERGQGTVLVVDDEPLMLAFACEAVRELGYQAMAASDGLEACEIFRREASRIDVILLDMVMPGLSWEAVIQSLRAVDPHARIILSSGYNGARERRRAKEQGALAFLGKPYTVEALSQVLKRAASEDGGKLESHPLQ